jgi:biotin-(acetyl-CoA carboxylase) ligase
MTSLRAAADDRQIDPALLLDAFTARVEVRIDALRAGHFDESGWLDRQLTNGRPVRLFGHDGQGEVVEARRVDPKTGALIVAADGVERAVVSGEIDHLRLDGSV